MDDALTRELIGLVGATAAGDIAEKVRRGAVRHPGHSFPGEFGPIHTFQVEYGVGTCATATCTGLYAARLPADNPLGVVLIIVGGKAVSEGALTEARRRLADRSLTEGAR
jgi:hypothetical protein